MAWIIGIDEAGYGPNLGPLVMTAVACRVPQGLEGCDLWQRLASAVRRSTEAEDHRLVIGDSKAVYSPARGLWQLERSVLGAWVSPSRQAPRFSLSDLLDGLCPHSQPFLRTECWYTGETELPVQIQPDHLATVQDCFGRACRENQIFLAPAQSVVIGADQFNDLTARAGSKGAVLAHGLGIVLAQVWNLGTPEEDQSYVIDKHGGRNTYAALLQDTIPEGTVLAQQEGLARSVYRVFGLPREVQLTFQPRADAEHFCVALASMVSKYVREILMLEFNRFWQSQVPGLKPTAGYPVDAARFYEAIRPALPRLGISEKSVWRIR